MASSQSRGGDRMVHQDYIARIRYSNALPPPPNPPKLLDIPNTGLASGQYTTPGFASRLARDQPLNIEADAELGMPLDLVGMPGIFDGDESSIQAPLHAPAPHPHDRALLRPLSTLGKPKFSDSGVSFLRRTEYISSYQSKSRFDSTTSKSLIDNTGSKFKKAALSVDKESLEYIRNQVGQSFDTAAAHLKTFATDPRQIRHPTRRNLTCVDAKPLIPDLDGYTDAGGYFTVKFLTNPVPPSTTYDIRLESSVLRPVFASDEEQLLKEQAQEAHDRDPENNPPPPSTMEYEFFLLEDAESARKFKRKFDPYDPEKDDESLYTGQNNNKEGCFRYKRIRAYESATQSGSVETKYDEDVIIADHDGTDGQHEKAAYYYPVLQRTSIRPQRTKNINKNRLGFSIADDVNGMTDCIDVQLEDPSEENQAIRDIYKELPYGNQTVEEEEIVAEPTPPASPVEE